MFCAHAVHAERSAQRRFQTYLLSVLAALALALAGAGIFGMMHYSVAQRTREIGIRMALGADRRNVVRMVMRGAFFQAGLGLAIGVPVAILGARYMADQLYGVRTYDPLSLLIAVVVLLLSATVAGFIPARRAANIDPMTALRTE